MGELESFPVSLYEDYLRLLAPFAPHMAEELWTSLGHADSIHMAAWPKAVTAAQKDLSTVLSIPVQINGRLRGRIIVSRGAQEAEVKEAILASGVLKPWLPAGDLGKLYYKVDKIASLDTSD
jgi:leucyl-tRNA synthetase